MQCVLPMLCLTAFATVIGTWLYTSREMYSVGYVVYNIAILWTSISAGLYLSAFVISEIMAQQVGAKNQNRDFALLAYSSVAAYIVIIIVSWLPFFKEFLVLAFYSCYLYWTGIPHIINVEGQKRMIYTLLSFIIIAVVHFLMFFLFGNILRAILI